MLHKNYTYNSIFFYMSMCEKPDIRITTSFKITILQKCTIMEDMSNFINELISISSPYINFNM